MSETEFQHEQPRRREELEEPAKGEAMPQNGQLSPEINGPKCRHHGADFGNAVPLGQMLSYGPNGSQTMTITVTKTLLSATEVTSTKTDGSSSTDAKDSAGMTAFVSSTNPTASAFIGVTQAKDVDTGSTVTATTTGTSTIFNTRTITNTHSMSASASSLPSNSSDLISPNTHYCNSTQTNSAAAVSSTIASGSPMAQQPGLVAVSVIGSMAAFSMIGILIWYFCVKKQGKQKLIVKMNLRRRNSADVKTPQLEGQLLEPTRAIMLQQAELNKSGENDLNSFFATSAKADKDVYHSQSQQHHDNARSTGSQMETPKAQPSWIRLATSSSTPPSTPPMLKSNSQKSTTPSVGIRSSYPSALTPGSGALRTSASLSLTPAPLKPATKPAPIITNPRLDRLDDVSPLSPREMINDMSNTTEGAWRRASQALSPSLYQRLKTDCPEGAGYPRVDRRPTIPKYPKLEIRAQTDNGRENNWI